MMRTTLTLDDVAALLECRDEERSRHLRDLVNDALRRGLSEMTAEARPPQQFRTCSADLGRPRLADIDNVAEALAIVEGERFQ